MKKILATLLVCLMVVSLFAGCNKPQTNTPAGPEAITLKVWAPQEDQVDENSWLQTVLKKFEAAHPEYKITWDLGVCSEGAAKDEVTKDVKGAADVYMYASDQLGGLIEANALMPLGGSYLTNVQALVGSAHIGSVTHTDGKVYGFPYTNNTWFMYYNKDVFSAEDVKTMEAMLAKGKVAFPIENSWYIAAMYVANGGEVFGPAGNNAAAGITFGGDAGIAVTKYLVGLKNNANFVSDVSGIGATGLKNGTIGAYFSGSWDYAGLKDVLGDKLGAVQAPTVDIYGNGQGKQMKAFAGSKAVGVNPNCKHQKAAMQLAEFMTNAESQKLHYTMRGIIPAASALANDAEVKQNIVAVAEINTMANASIAQPSIPEMGSYWTPAENFGKAIMNGEVTMDNAAEKTNAWVPTLVGQ